MLKQKRLPIDLSASKPAKKNKKGLEAYFCLCKITFKGKSPTDDCLVSLSKQVLNTTNFAYIYCGTTWVIHFDQFWYQSM